MRKNCIYIISPFINSQFQFMKNLFIKNLFKYIHLIALQEKIFIKFYKTDKLDYFYNLKLKFNFFNYKSL